MKRLSLPPRIGRHDFWLILVPALFWALAVAARPYLMKTPCGKAPQQCSAQDIPALDKIGFYLEKPGADETSFFTQNASGVMAVALPLAWNVTRAAFYGVAPAAAAVAAGSDLVLFAEFLLWNGATTEAIRITAQRPRPFVYQNPAGEGGEPANYVSFVSGHTSFAASAAVGTVLILLGRGASAPWILIALLLGETLTFSTGIFRVLAGRHFITDVLGALISGTCVSFLLFLKRPRSE